MLGPASDFGKWGFEGFLWLGFQSRVFELRVYGVEVARPVH